MSEKLYGFDESQCVEREENMYGLDPERIVIKDRKVNLLERQTLLSDVQSTCPINHDELQNDFYRQMRNIKGIPLNMAQLQQLNFLYSSGVIGNTTFLTRKQIEFKYSLELLKAKRDIESGNIPFIDGNGIVVAAQNVTSNQYEVIKDSEIINRFIGFKSLAKERNRNSRDGYDIYTRNHTRKISKEDLRIEFEEFVYSLRPDEDIPKTTIDRTFKNLLYKVKYVEDQVQEKKIIKLSSYTVALRNGYYDIKNGSFTSNDKIEGNIFNKTALPANFLEEDIEPKVFDELLKASLGDDEKILTVLYEYMGAIFSGITIIKKIFVFQGVSNGGKSRIAKIIALCLDESDVIYIDKLTDLNDAIEFDNVMLVIIDELSDKKLNPSQVSKLKKLSNGSKQVKIIATTNHSISTESDGTIDKALLNRLAVMPFARVMDNSNPSVSSYEDICFEEERDVIVSKALKAFNRLFKDTNSISELEFSDNYPLNECVEQKVFPNQDDTLVIDRPCLQKVLQEDAQIRANKGVEDIFNQVYEITEEINPSMHPELMMQILNESLGKKVFCDSQSFGKKLKQCFGDKLRNERKNGVICYNLKYSSDFLPTQQADAAKNNMEE